MAEIHKPGQGVLVRRFAFWIVAALIVWGGLSLYTWLVTLEWDAFRKPLFEKSTPGQAFVIPLLDQRIDPAFFLTWGLIAVGVYLAWRLLNRAKSAEFLVETDSELKKVTWPGWKDVWSSSMIVLVFIALMTVFLIASDKVIGLVMDLMMGV